MAAKTFITGAALAIAALLVPVVSPVWAGRHIASGSASEIATTFQIDPAHDGNINFAAGFAPPLRQSWTKDVIYNIGDNPPIIADGAVFVSGGGEVLRIALQGGRTEFNRGYGSAWLTYDNGRLFLLNGDGILTAVTPDKGDKIWSTQLPDQSFFFTPPNAVNGQVFVSGEGSGGDLYAVDEATGKLDWEYGVLDTGGSSPGFGDGAVYEAIACNYYKVDPATGTTLWTKRGHGGGLVAPVPVYFNGEVMLQDECNRWKGIVLNAMDGKPMGGRIKYSEPPLTPAAFLDSKGDYLGVIIGNWTLHCWNINTGKQLWKFASPNRFFEPPIVINGIIYVVDSSANIFALDENGDELWTIRAPYDQTQNSNFTLTAGLGHLIFISGSVITAFVPK